MAEAHALLLLKAGLDRDDPRLDVARSSLEDHRIGVTVETPQSPQDVKQALARHTGAVDRVIIAGGDGSINMAAAALLEADLPVGVLPFGTANDLARSLAIPDNVPDACAVIAHARARRIDVAEVNGHYFFNVAHMGLAARVARQADGDVKRYLGPLAYFLTAWQAFRARRSFHAIIECNGKTVTRHVVQVSVGNGLYYGGGNRLSEDAAIDDGRLDLVTLPHVRGARWLALLPALRLGKVGQAADVLNLHGADIHVRTRKPRIISADGEEAGKTPAHFKVLPRALAMYTRSHE